MNGALSCPACGYDLGHPAGDTITCTECGRAFPRAALIARTTAAVDAALALLALGALGIILTSGVARFVNTGSGVLLTVVPAFLAISGTAAIGWLTSANSTARRWPVAIAILLALCTLHTYTNSAIYGGADADTPALLQPTAWSRVLDPLRSVLSALLIGAAAISLRRIAAAMGSTALRFACELVAISGFAAAVLFLLHLAHRELLLDTSLNQFPQLFSPSAAPSPPPYLRSAPFSTALDFFNTYSRTAGWLGLGVMACILRALWREERRTISR